MKQILTTLAIMLTCLSTTVYAEVNDSISATSTTGKTGTGKSISKRNDSTYVPTYTDTDESGVTVVSTSADRNDAEDDDNGSGYYSGYYYSDDSNDDGILENIMGDIFGKENATAVTGMISFIIIISFIVLLGIFLLPIIVILLIFRHNSKRRKERYRLMEKAIEAGQPIPGEITEGRTMTDTKAKGIKNMCLGAGLFIFLWGISNSFGLACIGALVGFKGLGQYLTAKDADEIMERNKSNKEEEKAKEGTKETEKADKGGDATAETEKNDDVEEVEAEEV